MWNLKIKIAVTVKINYLVSSFLYSYQLSSFYMAECISL